MRAANSTSYSTTNKPLCVCVVSSVDCVETALPMMKCGHRGIATPSLPAYHCITAVVVGGKESPTLRDKYLQWLQSGGTLDMSLFDLLRSMGFKCRVA